MPRAGGNRRSPESARRTAASVTGIDLLRGDYGEALLGSLRGREFQDFISGGTVTADLGKAGSAFSFEGRPMPPAVAFLGSRCTGCTGRTLLPGGPSCVQCFKFLSISIPTSSGSTGLLRMQSFTSPEELPRRGAISAPLTPAFSPFNCASRTFSRSALPRPRRYVQPRC